MKKLSLNTAKSLVSRELGISAAKMALNQTMGNKERPWYEMEMGNFAVNVRFPYDMDGVVVLEVLDTEGAGSVRKFFRMDSELSFSDAITDNERRIDTTEKAHNLSPATIRRVLADVEPGGDYWKGEDT